MTIGLRVRDTNTGLITVEFSDRLSRVIGEVLSGTTAGSITVPGFALGQGWAGVDEPPPPSTNPANYFRYPRISISGNTLSWDFPGESTWTPVSCTIRYGVF